MPEDLLHELAKADPLLARHDLDEPAERLVRIHRVLEARADVSAADARTTAESGSPSRRHRRWLVLAGATTAIAVVGSVGLSLLNPQKGPSLAATSIALTAAGTLDCGGGAVGRSEEIDPTSASVRYLPSYLPKGWRLGHVWAQTESGANCYTSPSLTAVVRQSDGLVTRSAMVYGPIDGEITVSDSTSSPATIAGRPGRMLVRSNPKGADELYWLWSDATGARWLMRTYGFDQPSGRKLAAALSTSGDLVDLDASSAPTGTSVVHRRTGAPYPTRATSLRWNLTLGRAPMTGRDGEVTMAVTEQTGAALGTDGIFPGEYVVTEMGHSVVKQFAYGGLELYQPAPGLTIGFQPSWSTGGQPTLGSMSPADWEKVVMSLVDVPADDPRLTRLSLSR